MGTRTIKFDDMSPAEDADETVSFSLDGKDYEIDLTQAHSDQLRSILGPYMAAARKSGKGTNVVRFARTKPAVRQPAAVDPEQAAAIREWGRKRGYKVSNRGRISAELLDDYHRRDTNDTASETTAPPTSALEPRNAATKEEFKTAFQAWAQAKAIKINPRNGLAAPSVVARFSEETGLYKPEQTLPKAG